MTSVSMNTPLFIGFVREFRQHSKMFFSISQVAYGQAVALSADDGVKSVSPRQPLAQVGPNCEPKYNQANQDALG